MRIVPLSARGDPGDDPDQGCLAYTIRSQHPKDAAFGHGKTDMIDRLGSLVVLDHIGQFRIFSISADLSPK